QRASQSGAGLMFAVVAAPREREAQWMGEGVSQLLGRGLAQHPAFVQIERARLRGAGQPETWTEVAVAQAARAVRADAVLFGRIERRTGDLAVLPRLLEVKASGSDAITNLEPVPTPDGELPGRLPSLPGP